MGIALWLTGGLVALLAARIVQASRPDRWIGEGVTAVVTAAALGVVATFLDFGGWGELDWRAGLFVFFGAFASIGVFRLVTSIRGRTLQ